MTSHDRVETEPPGITYDRLRMIDVQADLVRRFGLQRVVEVDAGGAKARPSLYSIGFALAGCSVDLVGGDPTALDDWGALGLADRVRLLGGEAAASGSAAGGWDLAWNFVSASADPGFARRLASLSALAPLVMTVHCNGLHIGQPWHRLLHLAFGLPWTHGRWQAEFPGTVGLAYREAGLRTVDCGFFDAPGWPDPPGFRDVRLHLQGVTGDEGRVRWRAPVIDIVRSGRVPTLLRLLRIQESLQPIPLRVLLAHLYYHVGRIS